MSSIADNTTTTYTDNIADTTLGIASSVYNTTSGTIDSMVGGVRFAAKAINNQPLPNFRQTPTPFIQDSSTTAYSNTNVTLGKTVNIARWTETPIGHWSPTANATLNAATYLYGNITLTNLVMTQGVFTDGIYINSAGMGMTITPGQMYMVSYYIKSNQPVEQFIWAGNTVPNTTSEGWGAQFIDQTVRRAWFTCVGLASNTVDCGTSVPTTAMGGGPATLLTLVVQGKPTPLAAPNNLPTLANVYIGGLQMEAITTEKQAIVAYGDSKTQYDCNTFDAAGCSSWTRYAEGLMHVPFYNRGIGGIRCDTMDTNYATSVTPLAVRAKYMILMCGTNDIGQGRTLAQIQANITSMTTKATADGLIPVMGTVGPFLAAANNPAFDSIRLALNAWISQTYPYVLDFDSIDRDDYDPRFISRDKGWYPMVDGTHPLMPARRAEGNYVACSYVGNTQGCPQIWNFQVPGIYQPVPGATAPVLGGESVHRRDVFECRRPDLDERLHDF